MAGIHIPQPSPELDLLLWLGMWPHRAAQGLGACLFSGEHPGTQLEGESRACPGWGLAEQTLLLLQSHVVPDIHFLPGGDT